jgi:hypothetical protein
MMAMVDVKEPDLIVAVGKPSIPGPTAVPIIKLTAPQKFFLLPSGVSNTITSFSLVNLPSSALSLRVVVMESEMVSSGVHLEMRMLGFLENEVTFLGGVMWEMGSLEVLWG